MQDDLLKLIQTSEDPRFKGQDIAIDTDGLVRPVQIHPDKPRLFEIIPTVSTTRLADGTVEHDDRVMYMLSDEAEAALDVILEPHGGSGAWYLDRMKVKSPGPWAYVCLRKEYEIANYLYAQRAKLSEDNGFAFTFYDNRVDVRAAGFIPKVGCLVFYSKASLAVAAKVIRFLEPAWLLLQSTPMEKHWLVVLDEEPALVIAEAAQRS